MAGLHTDPGTGFLGDQQSPVFTSTSASGLRVSDRPTSVFATTVKQGGKPASTRLSVGIFGVRWARRAFRPSPGVTRPESLQGSSPRNHDDIPPGPPAPPSWTTKSPIMRARQMLYYELLADSRGVPAADFSKSWTCFSGFRSRIQAVTCQLPNIGKETDIATSTRSEEYDALKHGILTGGTWWIAWLVTRPGGRRGGLFLFVFGSPRHHNLIVLP